MFVIASVAYAAGGHSSSGGNAGPHSSTEAAANSNGPNSSDRDKGLDRADDRRNKHSLDKDKGHKDRDKDKDAKHKDKDKDKDKH